MIKEFRDFLMRGNLVELAVAFVMGLAFAALITSFVNDLIMPIVAMIIGKPDLSDLTFTINDAVFGTARSHGRHHVRFDGRSHLLLRREARRRDRGADEEA
jgi:large conductance mechanosensitive channel protein